MFSILERNSEALIIFKRISSFDITCIYTVRYKLSMVLLPEMCRLPHYHSEETITENLNDNKTIVIVGKPLIM